MTNKAGIGCVILVGLGIAISQCSRSEDSTTGSSSSSSSSSRRSGARQTGTNLTPLPLPRTGVVAWQSSRPKLAPFAISTRGTDNYFVKLTDSITGKSIGTFFIAGGRTLDVQVPLGSFELRYAAGETWYGEPHLFGPDTSYSRADDIFHFSQTPDGYSGYTVELYRQRNGNLRSRALDPEDF